MGVAGHNRGSRVLSRDADERMPPAAARADRQASADESDKLRKRVAILERELRRARRCLAVERLGRERLRVRLSVAQGDYAFGVGVLCRRAFPADMESSQ